MAGNSVMFIGGCVILLVTAFPIVQISLGAVYIYECPVAPVIPVYMMVYGILALLVMGLFVLPKLLCPAWPGNTIWTLSILNLLLLYFIVFIYGSYVIYSIYPPNYNKNATDPDSNFSAPDNKLSLTLKNQNQILPNLNQTWIANNNQTSRKLIQSLALSNKANVEHLNPPQARQVMPAMLHCDQTVYLFAFWTTTVVYVFAGNALVTLICLYGFMKMTNMLSERFTI